MAKLRVGVIGTGFGGRVQVPAFQAHPRVEVVAVSSGQPGKARAVADDFGIRWAFDDYAELAAAELDLVSITAPPHLHHPMTMAALASGRHVLCEKPMALSTTEAVAMLEAAQGRGVIHLIDHEMRFNPNRRKMRALIADGFIGQPRHALITVVQTGRSDPGRRWTWWHDAGRGGGILGAFGSHQIDLLRYLLGEVEEATGTLGTYIKERPDPEGGGGLRPVTADDFASFSLRFAGGAVGTVLLSLVAAHPRGPRLEVWGADGTLLLEHDGQGERLLGGRRGGPLVDLTEPETLAAPPVVDYDPLFAVAFVRLVDHIVQVVLDGAEVAPAATFHDGVRVQEAMDAIRLSSRLSSRASGGRAGDGR